MASTNKTTHLELSQYIGTDKPTYLTDYNQDMNKIDTGVYNAQAKADVNENNIGDLTNLNTTTKSSLVGAVNEVNTKAVNNYTNIGDLTNLDTTEKTNLVGAINEVNTNSINNSTNIGNLTNLNTTTKSNLVGAVNEVNTKAVNNSTNIGDLTNLNTTTKSSLVGAINEVYDNINVYSTVETIVGTYQNKPLYRKIIEWEGNISSSYNTGITNFDHLIEIHGTAKLENNIWVELPGSDLTDPLVYCDIYLNHAGTEIDVYKSSNSFYDGYIVIEYTKTTD